MWLVCRIPHGWTVGGGETETERAEKERKERKRREKEKIALPPITTNSPILFSPALHCVSANCGKIQPKIWKIKFFRFHSQMLNNIV